MPENTKTKGVLEVICTPTLKSVLGLGNTKLYNLLNQVCSSFEESKPLKVDERLDVFVVAELSLDRIWDRFYV